MLAAFVLFKKNSSLLIWESRRRIVAIERAATLSMEAGYLRSKRAYKAMLADEVESGMKQLRTITTVVASRPRRRAVR